jgi:hypothetical protein
MRKFLLLALAAMSFNTYAINPLLHSSCAQGAATYAPIAVYLSSWLRYVKENAPKLSRAESKELADKALKVRDDVTDREINKIREASELVIKQGGNFQDTQIWREIMEICFYLGMALSVEVPNSSELTYKRLIEDKCRSTLKR